MQLRLTICHRFWRLVSNSFLNLCAQSHQGLASLLDRVRALPQSWGEARDVHSSGFLVSND